MVWAISFHMQPQCMNRSVACAASIHFAVPSLLFYISILTSPEWTKNSSTSIPSSQWQLLPCTTGCGSEVGGTNPISDAASQTASAQAVYSCEYLRPPVAAASSASHDLIRLDVLRHAFAAAAALPLNAIPKPLILQSTGFSFQQLPQSFMSKAGDKNKQVKTEQTSN